VPGKLVPNDPKELTKLLERAQGGDKTTLPALRELLKQPHIVEACGNMAAHAEHTLIRKFSGKDLAVNEGVRRKMESLRAELAGASPTPLERLLVERIVACWLHVYHLEATYAGKESMTLELGAYYQRSLSAAHKRYLSAIKALAVVRKLALPVLQVNIARKQVNVAAPAAPDPLK
jgi:hypothetical protein